MADYKKELIETYNHSAKALAQYFATIGSRTEDVERAFRLAGHPKNAKVLEIGCGDGRDAQEIIKYTKNYEGFDISEELIKIARAKVPKAKFTHADMLEYEFPGQLDMVFAFASLLHLPKEELAHVLQKVYEALKPQGILYVSLKWSDHYEEKYKKDRFGRRLFFFYNPEIISQLAGSKYRVVHLSTSRIGHTEWFEMALQKH